MGSICKGTFTGVSRPVLVTRFSPPRRRFFSVKPDKVGPGRPQRFRARIERITSRLPPYLQRYTAPLIQAPMTHIASFLFLHEITAVIPLVALTLGFHYAAWTPTLFGEGIWIREGFEKFNRYFKKKGWLDEEIEAQDVAATEKGEGGTRIVIEVAVAYAITKALLPLRLVLSVWATPWFAGLFIDPVTRTLRAISTRR